MCPEVPMCSSMCRLLKVHPANKKKTGGQRRALALTELYYLSSAKRVIRAGALKTAWTEPAAETSTLQSRTGLMGSEWRTVKPQRAPNSQQAGATNPKGRRHEQTAPECRPDARETAPKGPRLATGNHRQMTQPFG
ncbi:hypothetical protein NDU88_000903 [Pleurodeles waltl]|uniref:Uncharacterized protein n=1 Tax=Pleurodeles waltl TaxID=8319 RepID=A0AAV7URB9_PLEWA|nr:hypothetical protein NDU88_000903 [Pleurodeles waltl]